MNGTTRLLKYIEGLARPDGGYGWDDQPDSYIVPTFAAIGVYHLLGQTPPRCRKLADYMRMAHPIRSSHTETRKHNDDPRMFLYQQIQALQWLQEDTAEFYDEVRNFTHPQAYPKMYEIHEYPLLREQALALMCRHLLHIPPTGAEPIIAYLNSRKRPNGSYNNTPASDGTDGHLLNTWWALMALQDVTAPTISAPDVTATNIPAANLAAPTVPCPVTECAITASPLTPYGDNNSPLIAWLQQCQLPDGGFSYQPEPGVGWVSNALYTLAAVWSLKHLNAQPADHAACLRYLLSLVNADGGCAHRPGEPSCPMATLYVTAALHQLGTLDDLGRMPGRPAPHVVHAQLPANLHVYSVQLQAPGVGSPQEAVFLAKELKIHLWGAKNSSEEWVNRAQRIAAQEKVPVTFFQANEEYGIYVDLPGLGCYTHVDDPAAPAGVSMGDPPPKQQPVAWEDFRAQRIDSLIAKGGRMVWQICDNEELAQILLDDTLQRGGYAAISTFHFGCRNMAYTLPFVFRYRHLIPFVGLQDAHGVESWWWTDHLVGFRTLFLGTEPTWDAWLQALERQWVVAARHDAETHFCTRLLGGAPGVQEFVRSRQSSWQWWNDCDPQKLERPLFSAAIIRPDDQFEAACLPNVPVLRLRCQWAATHLAVLLEPVVEIVSLSLDGQQVQLQTIEKRNDRGKLVDHYYAAALPELQPGRHVADIELHWPSNDRRLHVEHELQY